MPLPTTFGSLEPLCMYVKTTDTSTGTKRGVYMAAEQSNTDLLGSIVELSKL